MTKCYLDIDIGDARASFKRASEFVKGNSIKYGLSSEDILKLGGREVKSLPAMYNSDFEWSQKGRMQARPQKATRLVIELFEKEAPLACENFLKLCTGEKGKAKGSGVPLWYKGSKLHRLIPGFILQGGDFVFGNGSGGESIWGKKFKDDPAALKLKHDCRGVVSMGNSGKNQNTSQFFITLADKGAPQCDKRHAVFGKVVSGLEVLDLIEKRHAAAASTDVGPSAELEEPAVSLTITECGMFCEGDMPLQGYYDADDKFIVSANIDPSTSLSHSHPQHSEGSTATVTALAPATAMTNSASSSSSSGVFRMTTLLLLLCCFMHGCDAYTSYFETKTLRWDKYGSTLSYVAEHTNDATSSSSPPSGRPALLLLPGFGVGTFHFQENVRALRKNFDVYSIDLLGQGLSWPDQPNGSPECNRLQYSVNLWAEQVDYFIDNVVGRPVHVAGNSLGGFLGAVLAHEHPTKVKSLSLLNATPFWAFQAATTEPATGRLWDGTLPAPSWALSLGSAWFNTLRNARTVKTLLSGVYSNPASVDDELVANIVTSAAHRGGPEAFTSIAFSPKHPLTFDQLLAEIQCPLTLVMGREDPWVVPYWAQRAKRIRPDCLYLELSNSGHCPHQESPSAVNFILASLISAVESAHGFDPISLGPTLERTHTEESGVTVHVRVKDGSPENILERLAALFGP